MAPKRRARPGNADSSRQPKRVKVDATEYSAWGWVGTEVQKPEQITLQHVLAAYGLSEFHQYHFHSSLYTGAQPGSDQDGVIIVEDDACDKKSCKKNLLCTNFLGQEKWADYATAKKLYMKHRYAGDDPNDSMRDGQSPVGLENLGATCYANALLQVWFRNREFRQAVYQCRALSTSIHAFSESPIFQLQVTFAALELSKRRTFNPIKLVESLKLRASDQQDAQEFSKLFLSHLEKEFERQDNPDLRTLIQRRFEGQQTYVTLCHGCQRRSELASNFYELELSLKPDATIEDRISSVLAPEVLNGDNQYHCSGCDSLNDATRSIELTTLPPVLHISLLRFVFDAATLERKKSKHQVSFPVQIDMAPFLAKSGASPENTPQLYRLSGVLLHKGASAYHGHYETEIDLGDSQWFSFNDETVNQMKNPFGSKKKIDEPSKAKRMHSKDAYMLVYSQVSDLISAAAENSQSVVEPPPTAIEEVTRLNHAFGEEIQKSKEEERLVIAEFDLVRERTISTCRSWVPTLDSREDLVVVSRQALEDFLSRSLSLKGDEHPEGLVVLSNENIMCKHGKLDPLNSSDMKLIRNFTLPPKFTISPPPLSIDAVCVDCVRHEFTERLWAQRHPVQVKQFEDACEEEIVDVDSGCWLSKAWLRDWKLQKPKLHVAGQGDPPPDHSDYLSDVICEHGALACDQSRRQHVPADAMYILQDLFPAWVPICSGDPCPVCQVAAIEAHGKLQEERSQATIEKAQLKQAIDNALEEIPAIVEETDYAILLYDFARRWKKWTMRPANVERPEGADMSVLICEHAKLAADLNVRTDWKDTFVVVKKEDWQKMAEHYSLVQLITARKVKQEIGRGSQWTTDPPVCHDCRIRRKSSYEETQISVRVIRATTRDGTLASTTTSTKPPAAPRLRRAPHVKQVTITPSMQVKDLKVQLQAKLNVSTIAQRLVHNGRELDDSSATMATLGVLAHDELEVHVLREDASLLDDDVDMGAGDRAEGPGFEGTLLGFAAERERDTPSGASEGVVDAAGLTCPTCTFLNGLELQACEMCDTPLG